jgi:hypothetical protein
MIVGGKGVYRAGYCPQRSKPSPLSPMARVLRLGVRSDLLAFVIQASICRLMD